MNKKYAYLVLFVALIAFSSCSSKQESNESNNDTATSIVSSYELPSEEGIVSSPYTSDIPTNFPRSELVPENVEIQSEGSETRNDLNLATIVFKSSQSQEELVTFYKSAFDGMSVKDLEESEGDNTFSFSGMTPDNEQIDVSGIKKNGETTYLVTITYYYNK